MSLLEHTRHYFSVSQSEIRGILGDFPGVYPIKKNLSSEKCSDKNLKNLKNLLDTFLKKISFLMSLLHKLEQENFIW